MFLVYGGEEELLVRGYANASFQTDRDDCRSQSGFVYVLNGGAVHWMSSKQDTVADSTIEAAKEGVWIRNILEDLGIFRASVKSLDLYCDNSGAIAQAKEPRYHHKTRHIDRKYHLIRKIVKNGDVELCKIHTDANVVDPLTKPLPQSKHEGHARAMGI